MGQFLNHLEGDNGIVLLADEKGKLERPHFIRFDENIKIAVEVDLKKFIEDEHYYILKDNYHYLTYHFKDVDSETIAILLLRMSKKEVVALNSLSTMFNISLNTVILLVLVIFTVIVLNKVTKQILIAKESISKFENGDVTVRFDATASNELGDHVKSLAQAVEKLRNAFTQVQTGFGWIEQSVSKYVKVNERLKEVIKKANHSVEQVVSIAENVSASIE